MKYLDEYRDAAACRRLVDAIRRDATRPWTIMEVCGGQTHGLLRWGIDQQLKDVVTLLHGPGCPVCVTSVEAIDTAIELSKWSGVTLASFGDMLRVPGSRESLLDARAEGANVQLVYSPLDAVELARSNPRQQVVFFAVGFETTTPATALAVMQAAELELTNFSVLVAHVCVQPAMELIASDEHCSVDGFLAAGHVCTVAGYTNYESFARRHGMPVVVTGFEPVDLLTGIRQCVFQLERGDASVANCYERCVSAEGNVQALAFVDEVFEICDRPWRGFGEIAQGGLRLRESWFQFDASLRFPIEVQIDDRASECRSGDVLTGRIKPPECECFGNRCTPTTPLGAPMVSAEGACAAYYRYASQPS